MTTQKATCRTCGPVMVTPTPKAFKDGTVHYGARCPRCQQFMGWLPQNRPSAKAALEEVAREFARSILPHELEMRHHQMVPISSDTVRLVFQALGRNPLTTLGAPDSLSSIPTQLHKGD